MGARIFLILLGVVMLSDLAQAAELWRKDPGSARHRRSWVRGRAILQGLSRTIQEIAFTAVRQAKPPRRTIGRDLLSYAVVVLYDMPKTITEDQKTRFRSLFDKGTGLVVLHHALVSYQDWPDYERVIGGKYSVEDEKAGIAGYRHDVEIPVHIVAPDHPITTGLKDFVIHDEIYWGFHVQPGITPLLTTTDPAERQPDRLDARGGKIARRLFTAWPWPFGLWGSQLP